MYVSSLCQSAEKKKIYIDVTGSEPWQVRFKDFSAHTLKRIKQESTGLIKYAFYNFFGCEYEIQTRDNMNFNVPW